MYVQGRARARENELEAIFPKGKYKIHTPYILSRIVSRLRNIVILKSYQEFIARYKQKTNPSPKHINN